MAEFLSKAAFTPLKTEIEKARDDAENHAQAVAGFTDAESVSFDKGAKGWSQDAATSETNAATSASNAATSETNAANSASAAATSETNTATSETNAAASASAAEAALDTFDDRFLGSKSSDPSLDNDGNALLTGALYWNSTDSVLKAYDGSAWRVESKITGLYHDITDLTAVSDGQTTFNETYDVGAIKVLINGTYQPDTNYTATNGTSIVLDNGVQTGDVVTIVHLVKVATATTGTQITFVNQKVWNTVASPGTGNITDDLTDARIRMIQKVYHNDSTEPTVPVGWVKLNGSQNYVTGSLNIIFAEWVSGTRVEYWLLQEL